MAECILTILITCTAMTALTPAEAAAVLAPNQFKYVPEALSVVAPQDRIHVIQAEPGAGPFGPFRSSLPRRRLDGTSYDSPPQILGLPYYHPYNLYRDYGVVLPQAEHDE